MIVDSPWLMTGIALVIIAVAVPRSTWYLRSRPQLRSLGVERGLSLILGGLGGIAAFYAIGLVELHATPWLDEAASARLLRSWLLEWSWIAALLVVCALATGLQLHLKALLPKAVALEERGRFQQLLSELSAAFVTTPADEIDTRIHEALGVLSQFMGADRSYLVEASGEGSGFRCADEWCRDGIDSASRHLLKHSPAPFEWTRDLGSDGVFVVRRVADLPPSDDRSLLVQRGVRSLAVLPVVERGRVKAGIVFEALVREGPWTTALVQRMRLAGEILASARQRAYAELALRESEARFRTLLDNASDQIAEVDDDGHIVYASPSWKSEFGYDVSDFVGVRAEHLIHPDDWERVGPRYGQLFRNGGALRSEYRLVHRDGRWLHVETSASVYRVSDGGQRLVSVTRNVSDRKRAEQALREVEAQLWQSQRVEALGRLSGGIAHDLNNLLTVINGYGELLLGELDDAGRAEASEILRAGERSASLVRKLLAFGRRQMLRPEVIDLNGAVEQLVPILDRMIGEQVEIRVDLAPSLCAVRIDPVQLEQVIVNLAINARDAMPAGGRLSLSTRQCERAGRKWARLRVEDTGCGVGADIEGLVFEPFFTTKREGEGTGLGLSTVHGIVRQSGGEVRLDSRARRGAAFDVYLPPSEEKAVADGRAAPEVPARDAPADACILVVEDDASLRRLLASALERGGHRVLQAQDGETALALVARHDDPVALVLTDVVIPGMSGLELFRALRCRRPEARVLFMSGYDAEPTSAGPLPCGADLIRKPFTPRLLRDRVRRALQAADGVGDLESGGGTALEPGRDPSHARLHGVRGG